MKIYGLGGAIVDRYECGSAATFTLGDVLREHWRSRPDLLAVVDGGVRLTYRDWMPG